MLGFCLVIVSGEYSPAYLDGRIEAFLASFTATLKEMTAEEFEKNRAALIAAKMQAST